MMTLRRVLVRFLMGLVCIVGVRLDVYAQTGAEVDENVKVKFLNEWRDGVIVQKTKKQYLVEFEFANKVMQEPFDRNAIRRMCEVEAIDLSRIWENSTGTSKIEAALKSVSTDKVKLIKVDGEEVDISIEKLSEKDIKYAEKFLKTWKEAIRTGKTPAAYPSLPPLEEFDSSNSLGGIGILTEEGKVEPLGSLPSFYKEFQQSGAGFYLSRSGQEPIAVIPVGGPEQLVLLTAREDNFLNRFAPFQSQGYWISLKQKKLIGFVPLPPEDYILDYDPRSKLLVSMHRHKPFQKSENDYISIWRLKPGETEATSVVRWNASLRATSRYLPLVKFIGKNLLLTETDDNTYVAWDFAEKKDVYSFKTNSTDRAGIIVSRDTKHLLLPEDGNVRVLEAATGNVKFCLPVKDRHVSGVNINADGTRLVAVTGSSIYVWDLTKTDPEPKIHDAPLVGSPFSSRIDWIDDDSVFVESMGRRVLFRLSLQLPIWSYNMDVGDSFLNNSPFVSSVVNGLYFYLAKPNGLDSSIAVGAVKLPGPKVEETVGTVERDSLMILKPGTQVGIQLGEVSDPGRVEGWLKEKIAANGWVYNASASIKMHASMGVGSPTNVTYQQIGTAGKKFTELSYTPHFAKLDIKKGDFVIWQTGTSTSPPTFIRGGNVQSAVSQVERPQLDFFRNVQIPERVIDPKYSRGFGASLFGLKGITVVSTSPPGRDANPMEAEKKRMAEEFEKLKKEASR